MDQATISFECGLAKIQEAIDETWKEKRHQFEQKRIHDAAEIEAEIEAKKRKITEVELKLQETKEKSRKETASTSSGRGSRYINPDTLRNEQSSFENTISSDDKQYWRRHQDVPIKIAKVPNCN